MHGAALPVTCRRRWPLPAAARRLQVLGLLEQHAAALCGDAPQELVRLVYEAVRDGAAASAADGPEGAARAQLVALRVLTSLLVALEMQQRDARLVKVHVEALVRILERAGPHAGAPPELRRCAAACLRRLEAGAPTLLLAGSKQLLDLARAEISGAAESLACLAACVLSHGAERCLDARAAAGEEESAHGGCGAAQRASQAQQQRRLAAVDESAAQDAAQRAFSVLSSIDCRALSLGAGASVLSGASSASIPMQLSSAGHTVSPSGTLEAAATAFASVASGRSSEWRGRGLLWAAAGDDCRCRGCHCITAAPAGLAGGPLTGWVALAHPLSPALQRRRCRRAPHPAARPSAAAARRSRAARAA